MKIEFWGVRGSIPSPFTPIRYKDKLMEVLEFVLQNKDTNNLTPNSLYELLPNELKSIYGGNTSCVSIINDDNLFIFDAGSGINNLGNALLNDEDVLSGKKIIHIFFSHTHLDHICGLPMFQPLYRKGVNIKFYSVHDNLEEKLSKQQASYFFPVELKNTASSKEYIKLSENKEIKINNLTIGNFKLIHPGVSYSYSIIDDLGKKIVYSTDGEYKPKTNFDKLHEFYKNADILIFDAQYSLLELATKINFGHSTPTMGVDFAINSNVKNLVLFHHDPNYNDKEILKGFKTAQNYLELKYPDNKLKIHIANEGMEFTV